VRHYRAVFTPVSNIFHPNEAAASLFAMLIVVDHFPSRTMTDGARIKWEKNLGPLRVWFRENLGKEKADATPAPSPKPKRKHDSDAPAPPAKGDF
jgi:hypothetical protein